MAKTKIKSVPNKLHVRTGDTVVLISGRDKNLNKDKAITQNGRKTGEVIGKVLKVYPKTGKIIVEGVNVKTKHIKPNAFNGGGSIEKKEMPIFASKVMLWDSEAKRGTRVRYEIRDGKKVRISVASGKEI